VSHVVIGIDLGGTFVKAAAVTRDRRILHRDKRPTRADEGPAAVMDVMAEALEAAVEGAGAARDDVLAVGIGAPGPLDWQRGFVYELPNLPGWHDIPLGETMHERLGLPCFVENDANAACYGEFWLGAGQGAGTMCTLTLGTGVGGGLVVFGRLLRGIDGTAAEIGHMKVMRGGRTCGCGAQGCLETYGSVTGMVRTAVEGIESGRETILTDLCGGDLTQLTGKVISEAASRGDAFAAHVIEETGVWLGVGISSLINLLNPEMVVLCGGMIKAGEALFEPIRRTAKEQSFDVPAGRAAIVPAGLGADSGVIGAAGCALDRCEEGAQAHA